MSSLRFSSLGLSLVMQPAGRKPRRRLGVTVGMDPIERALWHCTKAEQHLYQWFKKHGDGPVKFEDTPLGKNASRAIPVLEHLGLIRVERRRFDPVAEADRPTSTRSPA
jgi:hypothetical protein